MSTGLIVLITGLVVSFGAFAYAGRNMWKLVSEGDIFGGFKRHIGAIVVMALGGLTSTIGAILWIAELLKK